MTKNSRQYQILRALRDGGRQTCDALEQTLEFPHQSVSAFLSLNDGLLVRRTSRQGYTRSGRPASLYEITSEGRQAVKAARND